MMQVKHSTIGCCAAYSAALLLCCGCAGGEMFFKRNNHPVATAANPVGKILCFWEPSEGHGVDGLPTRGFAGQLLFMTSGGAMPAEVNGDVRIYVFDDQGTYEEQIKPIHQFDFKSAAWNRHLGVTTLGPAYQVFIPYTRKGPHQAHCALRVRFKPSDGPEIFSEMVKVILPGSIKPTDETTKVAEHQAPLRVANQAQHDRLSTTSMNRISRRPLAQELLPAQRLLPGNSAELKERPRAMGVHSLR